MINEELNRFEIAYHNMEQIIIVGKTIKKMEEITFEFVKQCFIGCELVFFKRKINMYFKIILSIDGK